MARRLPPQVSLLTAYRRRHEHLICQRQWLQRLRESELETFEWIVIEGDVAPTASSILDVPWCRYVFEPMAGPFNKARLLNIGAGMASSEWLCPLDVDLLPAHGTLSLHQTLAPTTSMLVTGFRVQMLEVPTIVATSTESSRLWRRVLDDVPEVLCPEDRPTALRKYILEGQRFGVCPFYDSREWEKVGGMDTEFVGWGGEDQDLIARILALGRVLVRAYDLLYFHLPHGPDPQWRDSCLTARNRQRFHGRYGGSRSRNN